MELKDAVIVTKPIEGIYGSRMYIQGEKEKQIEFNKVCQDLKEDAGLMQSNDTSYEFLHQSQESIKATAFHVAESLNVPVLFL